MRGLLKRMLGLSGGVEVLVLRGGRAESFFSRIALGACLVLGPSSEGAIVGENVRLGVVRRSLCRKGGGTS